MSSDRTPVSQLLVDKVAYVTGSGSGIGAATAMAMADEGASVVVADIDSETGPKTVDAIQQAGGEAFFHQMDVRDEAQVIGLVEATVARYGRLDCAVNNAGSIGPVCRVGDLELEAWNEIVTTNMTGCFLCTKHAVRQMLKQGDGGAIVNTASGLASTAWAGFVDYAASKAGVMQISKTAAIEYAKDGIRVNSVLPGTTGTAAVRQMEKLAPPVHEWMLGMMPIGRYGEPEEIAQAILWLCSDRASFMAGAPLSVDGGMLAGAPSGFDF